MKKHIDGPPTSDEEIEVEERRAGDMAQSKGVCYQLEDLSFIPQAHMVGREK